MSTETREKIKKLLAALDDGNRDIFMRMYSHEQPDRDINEVVNKMPKAKLAWALSQCENSYYKTFEILKR